MTLDPVDDVTRALAVAVTYPEQAFFDEPELLPDARAVVARAGAGEDVQRDVRQILGRGPSLKEWVDRVLEDPEARPPHLQPRSLRSFDPLPGTGDPVPTFDSYGCARDGFTWFRRSVDQPVPACPFCGGPLTGV